MKRNRTIIGFAVIFTLLTCVAAGLMAQNYRQSHPAKKSREHGEHGRARDKKEAQEALKREARITLEQARAIALQREAGSVESEELEREHGKLVYSFDIRNARGTITEVQVSALDNSIVAVEEETAAQEAAERAADKRQHRRYTRNKRHEQR